MIEGLSPQEFLDITREKFRMMVREAKPLMCWYSITEECDLHCKFCFADSHRPWDNELTTQEVYDLLDNIAEAGTRAIVFGGGEPTLRPDLLDVIRYAARYKGMFVALNTHGQHLSRTLVRGLANAGVSQVKVSVDGLRESHEWNRGPGTFDKCMQALKNCVDIGIESVIWIATISQMNYHEVPQMVEMAMGLGVDICMVQLFPGGRWKGKSDLLLTKDQVRDWQRFMAEQQKVHGWQRIQFENRYQICEDCYACHHRNKMSGKRRNKMSSQMSEGLFLQQDPRELEATHAQNCPPAGIDVLEVPASGKSTWRGRAKASTNA